MPGIFEAEAVGHLRDGFSGRQSVFGKFFGIITRVRDKPGLEKG